MNSTHWKVDVETESLACIHRSRSIDRFLAVKREEIYLLIFYFPRNTINVLAIWRKALRNLLDKSNRHKVNLIKALKIYPFKMYETFNL